MKKIFFSSLFCLLSFISFAQNKSNDSLLIADTTHATTERLIRQNDSIIQLNTRYEDSMRMLFTETGNKNTDRPVSDAKKREDKRNSQLYFRTGLGVFFLGLLVFRLVRKRKK
jgi:hypothetical protein